MYTNPTSRAEAQGNGVATEFPVSLQVYDVSHLKVWRFIPATQELALLVRGTDYNLTLNSDFLGCQVEFIHDLGGGPVVFAPPSGHEFIFLRVVPYTQEQDLRTYGATDKEGLERQLDIMAMGLSQLAEELSRSVKVSVAGVETSPDTLLAEINAAVSSSASSASSASASASAATNAKDAAEAAQAAVEAQVSQFVPKTMFGAAWDFVVGDSTAGSVTKKTFAEFWAYLTAFAVGGWTKQQYAPPVSVTPTAGAVTLDADLHQNCKIASTEALTMNAPANAAEGKMLFVRLYAATALGITWNAAFVGNADRTLPTAHTAGKDMFLQFYYDGANWVLLGGSERA